MDQEHDDGNPIPPGYENRDMGEHDELDTGAPAVAAAPGRLFLYLGLAGLGLFLVIYFIFLGEEESVAPPQEFVTSEDVQPHAVEDAPPVLPDIPPPPQPVLPPPPPIGFNTPGGGGSDLQFPNAPPPIPVPPEIDVEGPDNEIRQERIRSKMLVHTGSTNEGEQKNGPENALDVTPSDPNGGTAFIAERSTQADKAVAGHIGNPYATIAQGKLVHGVLETAINTQLPGTIRAIVSRDIYAEAGKTRLIPKGSRIIGTYGTDVLQGHSRVFIVWERIIRPDGIDIKVASPGVDQLGRAGLEGYADNKFMEIFGAAVLTSIISIGIASAADEVSGNDTTATTTNTDGSTTSSGDATTQAAGEAVENIGGVSRRLLDQLIDARPVITVDQGTRINILVNRDLIFPASLTTGTQFVK